MAPPTHVAVLGFSAFEHETLASFLRLPSLRTPPYALEPEPLHAHFVVADADAAVLWPWLERKGLLPRTIAIGATPRSGVRLALPRPIDVLHLARELDHLPRPQFDPDLSPHVQRVLETLAQHSMPMPLDDGSPAPAAAPDDAPRDDARREQVDHVLVVDDDDGMLRFMAGLLARYGFHVHLARSGVDALQRTAVRHFEVVFVDAALAGLDGFQTCRMIKRARHGGGRQPPRVVLLGRPDTPTDPVRARLVGADDCLVKPLRAEELLRVLGDREVERLAFRRTAAGTTLS